MNKVYGGILVVMVIAIGAYFFPKYESVVSSVVGPQGERGLTGPVGPQGPAGRDGKDAQVKVGAFPSPTIYEALELLGGTTFGKVNSTSTLATTYTLLAKDIVGYDTVVITPNVGDLTLTLPASSTMPNLVPKAGQRTKQCWLNASTTSGIDITFAAGTGIDLEVASSTVSDGTPVLTLLANSSACFDFIRKPATASTFDIVAQFTRFVDGD